jgi:hypothetical protein
MKEYNCNKIGLLLFLIIMLSALSEQALAKNIKIAIWRLKPLGLDAVTAERLEHLLRMETSRLEGFSLQKKDRTDAVLARDKNQRLRECGGSTSCLCEIGKVLRVNKLVTGVVGALGDDYTLDLKLVDVSKCSEQNRVDEALSGREDLLIGAIRQALYKLLVPKLIVGSLIVEVPVKGAEVLVDGKKVGMTPLPSPISGLKPGSHQLTIQKQGFSSFEESVPVRFQQTTKVKVDMVTSALLGLSYEKEKEEKKVEKKEEPKPLPPVVAIEEDNNIKIFAWSGVGLTAIALIGGIVAGWRASSLEGQMEDAALDWSLKRTDFDVAQRGKNWALWSNICWGVAGGAAALTGMLFLADMFDQEQGNEMKVFPSVGNESLGLGVRWSF